MLEYIRIGKVSEADLIIQHQVRPSIKRYLLFRLDCCDSYKDKVCHFLNSHGKVKLNLHVFVDECTYYYCFTQISILVINCILVCKLCMSREL